MSENGTAKTKTKWKRQDGSTILNATRPSGKSAEFDLARIWPEFLKMTPVQMGMSEYGIKQFLSDKSAYNADEKPSDGTIIEMWLDRFEKLVNGEIRVNASKAETIKVDKAKIQGVVDVESLQLMVKLGLPLTEAQKQILADEAGENDE